MFAGQSHTGEDRAFRILVENCLTPPLDCTEVLLLTVRCSVELYCYFNKLKANGVNIFRKDSSSSVASATVLAHLVTWISLCLHSFLKVEITVINPEIRSSMDPRLVTQVLQPIFP